MLIDRQAKPWVLTAAALFVIATIAYIPYHRSMPNGPSGGSLMGLIYGVAGTAMILFAIALTPRKRLRTLRIGRAYLWMQGHVWFGLLSFPVILYHAGFRQHLWGAPLTLTLMLLFIAIEVSGIIGLILQQILPTKLLRDVPYETVFEQIDHVVDTLRTEADTKLAALTTHKVEREYEYDALPAGATATMSTTTPGVEALATFYKSEILPFLQTAPARTKVWRPGDAAIAFDRLRTHLPVELHETANDLQSIADERRQLVRQKKLHTYLHSWLWIHVPLSFAMLVLIVVHAVEALRYVL